MMARAAPKKVAKKVAKKVVKKVAPKKVAKKVVKKVAPKKVAKKAGPKGVQSNESRLRSTIGFTSKGTEGSEIKKIAFGAADAVTGYGGGNGAAALSPPILAFGAFWVIVLLRFVLFYGFFGE